MVDQQRGVGEHGKGKEGGEGREEEEEEESEAALGRQPLLLGIISCPSLAGASLQGHLLFSALLDVVAAVVVVGLHVIAGDASFFATGPGRNDSST